MGDRRGTEGGSDGVRREDRKGIEGLSGGLELENDRIVCTMLLRFKDSSMLPKIRRILIDCCVINGTILLLVSDALVQHTRAFQVSVTAS